MSSILYDEEYLARGIVQSICPYYAFFLFFPVVVNEEVDPLVGSALQRYVYCNSIIVL